MFDARLTPALLSDADLETLWGFGLRGALVIPNQAMSVDDLDAQLENGRHQLKRMTARGFDGVTCACVPVSLAGEHGVGGALARLATHLNHSDARVLGPLMLTRDTEAQRKLFAEQLALATELARPVLVTAPIERHRALTTSSLVLLRQARIPPAQVLFDGLTDSTVRAVLARGHFAGLTLHPDRMSVDVAEALVHALGPERLVLGSGAGDGPSDLLALPRLVSRLKRARLTQAVIGRVSSRTCLSFLGRR